LVTEIRRDIALPVPHQLMVILLFVNDFCLIASSPSQLLAVMQIAQTSFENNRSTLGEIKSHGIPRDPRHTTSPRSDSVDDPLQLTSPGCPSQHR
jgi:hypothetical protein